MKQMPQDQNEKLVHMLVLIPTTPQNAAGCRIEPPVSEPNEKRTSPAATEAAEPPEEPPGTVSKFHGFCRFLIVRVFS